MIRDSFKGDYIHVTENKHLVRQILEQGDAEIFFSDYIEKFNTWNRRQKRLLVISEKAVYTFDANTFEIKRRIRIASIEAVHLSKEASDLFVIHVKGEHGMSLCRMCLCPHRCVVSWGVDRSFILRSEKTGNHVSFATIISNPLTH